MMSFHENQVQKSRLFYGNLRLVSKQQTPYYTKQSPVQIKPEIQSVICMEQHVRMSSLTIHISHISLHEEALP